MCTVSVRAAVIGTAHEQTVGDQDECSACHLRYKSFSGAVSFSSHEMLSGFGEPGAEYLVVDESISIKEGIWPEPMVRESTNFGFIGRLCYYCHGAGGGGGIPSAIQPFIMDAKIGKYSHGLKSANLPSPNDSVDSTLPYGGDSKIQCTTCHEVHDDNRPPFLQEDIDMLCARCHKLRQFVGGSDSVSQGEWGDAYYGTSNPGSHPVGTDVFTDIDNDSPVDIGLSGLFTASYGASSAYNLGGHLIDGARVAQAGHGLSCVTCHAVHGIQADSDPPSTVGEFDMPPVPNLLVIAQATEGGAFDGTVFNGNGDSHNALCEACHTTESTTIDASTGAAYTGLFSPNPGATAYGHPTDDLGASDFSDTTAFPEGWPIGSSTALNVFPGLICESCHTPHPKANENRKTISAGSGTHILRASEDPLDPEYLCMKCHDLYRENIGHHPSNVPMGRMGSFDIGDGDDVLTCSDCHQRGAHNWNGPGIGMDPDWEPPGNGRGSEQFERSAPGTSKECEDCHYNDNQNIGPTNNSADNGATVRHARNPDSGYQDIGEGTHYLGPTSMDYSLGLFQGGGFNALTDDWVGQGQPNPRWSRFDGPDGHVVCESCHELEADKNVPGTALLLAYYNDGEPAATNPENDPSGLCEGCHGDRPGGSGTPHPMTGDVVSRTEKPLSTAPPGAGGYSRGLNNEEGNATFSGPGGMNCDSCHQPHDADTHGGTYIYESGEKTSPPHDVSSVAQPGDGHAPTNRRGRDVQELQDAPFCDSCHFYLQ